MLVYRDPFPNLTTECVLALGTFDGVHIGHARVIDTAVALAKKSRMPAVVWCFSDLPRNFFLHDEKIPLICTPEKKLDLIAGRGVDAAVCPDVTAELLVMTPAEFLEKIIESLHPAHVVCGFNYTFGCASSGTTETLFSLLGARSIPLTVVEPVTYDGVPVSSTLIRSKIERGDRDVELLLGRDYRE